MDNSKKKRCIFVVEKVMLNLKQQQMTTYNITFKEVGNNHIMTTSHTGNLTKNEVIDFFGLNNNDVEWYEINEA